MTTVFLDGRVTLHPGDCLAILAAMPENSVDSVAPRTTPDRALEIGKAAEHLVVADLILSGHRAFLTDQGLPYDVVFDHKGRLLRVQVKATANPRPVPNRPGSGPSYQFHIRRSGKGSKRIIGNDEFEIMALVALDIRQIAYMLIGPKVLQTIHLRVPNWPGGHGNKSRGNINEYPIENVLAEMGI